MQSKSSKYKSIALATIGTIVEYYDYALYGFMAPTLSHHFFADSDVVASYTKIFLIYAMAYFSKPLGSLIIGTIGDQFGRKIALKFSIFGMAASTFLIGCLPTYKEIGCLAPMFLFILRFLQGIFVTGEVDGVAVYIYEICGSYKNLANSFLALCYSIGIFLASLMTSYIINHDLSWRIPFFFATLGAVFIFTLRHHLQESPSFSKNFFSFKDLLINHKREIIVTFFISGSVCGIYKMIFIFAYPFLEKQKALNFSGQNINSSILFISILASPLLGYLCDLFNNNQRIMKISILGVFTCLLLQYIFPINIMLIILTSLFATLYQIPGYPLINSLFKSEYRYRGLSMGHGLGSLVLSGSTPFISLLIVQISNQNTAIFGYGMVLLGLGYFGLLLIKR